MHPLAYGNVFLLTSHGSTLILKNLHPNVLGRQNVVFFNPRIDHSPNLFWRHNWQSLVGLGMKTHHSTSSSSSLRLEQRIIRCWRNWNILEQRRKIIGKDKCRVVLRGNLNTEFILQLIRNYYWYMT